MSKEDKKEPCINISTEGCWKCGSIMKVSYYSDNLQIPYGPSRFTEKQITIAKEAGCLIDFVHSKTSNSKYLANICGDCGAFIGDFFYHEYTYEPGDIQYFLDDNDNIILVKENK